MRREPFVILAALMLLMPARAAEVLSWQGVGPVQLGMTVKEAERALGKKLAPRNLAYTSDACYETSRADKIDPGITYVIENGKITVISVFSSDGQRPDVVDKNRLGIGTGEDDIPRAYGQVRKHRGFYDRGEPPENDPAYVPEFWIEADGPDKKRIILFITQAGKITSMATGFKPMVLEPEHCL
jgi:hypothetical protein